MGEVSGRDLKFRQALLNEVKGSLFEYLVAQQLATRAQTLGAFLAAIPSQYQQGLEQQERLLREVDPGLAQRLPHWAMQAAEAVWGHLPPARWETRLTGQLSASLGEELGACDVLLTSAQESVRLSLKLCKARAAVNTKSAGVKSFFTSYFPLSSAADEQARFSDAVEREHLLLRQELYAIEELPAESSDWGAWRRRGLPELPGELRPELRERLHAYYARLARALGASLGVLAAQDPQRFATALGDLAGLGPGQLQVICFHEYPVRPELEVRVTSYLEGLAHLAHWKPRSTTERASVNYDIGSWLLALRIKPMNTFTTTAIKINCSVRYEA